MSIQDQALKSNQSVKVHVKAIARDGTSVDTTAQLVATSTNTGIATASIDPSDDRGVLVTAVAPGTCFVFVDESPPCPTGGKLQMTVSVSQADLDNRRVDFVTADAPTP